MIDDFARVMSVDDFARAVEAANPYGVVIGPPVSATEWRANAIRAVVASQWALAVILVWRFAVDVGHDMDESDYERGSQDVADDIERFLPTAVQIVDGNR